ncbi:MAG TPA: SAM-dependent chlorinase/fluorinase [Methylomirabilota bacterium]|nr:SAM-dependent chlorinase/fluorinase [Methylomirabilota bacterium]
MASSIENLLRGQYSHKRGTEDRSLPPIVIVNDFGNHLSPAECQLSITNVFDAHRIPNGRQSKFMTIGDVKPFNVVDGAFQITQLAGNRRDMETVFVGVVDPGVGTERRGIVVQTKEEHTFIGPDNGLLSLAFGEQQVKNAYTIRKDFFDQVAPTFHGRDIFTPLAAEIAVGTDPVTIPALETIDPNDLMRLQLEEGHIVHHDGYQNAKLWKKGVPIISEGERAVAVTITPEHRIFDRGLFRKSITVPVGRTFEDVEVGGWLVYEGSSGRNNNGGSGHVEVAIREGAGKNGAGNRLGTPVGGIIGLEWHFGGKKKR